MYLKAILPASNVESGRFEWTFSVETSLEELEYVQDISIQENGRILVGCWHRLRPIDDPRILSIKEYVELTEIAIHYWKKYRISLCLSRGSEITAEKKQDDND